MLGWGEYDSSSLFQSPHHGYKAMRRPSGHDISTKFGKRNEGAIPSNLLQISNTESNSQYLRLCRDAGMKPHPARFPAALPEFFVKMLTDEGDLVVDPFAGSNVTGEVCERMKRRWISVDIVEEYVKASHFRFAPSNGAGSPRRKESNKRTRLGSRSGGSLFDP